MFLRRILRYGVILGLLLSTTALAKEVTQDRARIVAQNWIQHLAIENRGADSAGGTPRIAAEEVIFFGNAFVGYNFRSPDFA